MLGMPGITGHDQPAEGQCFNWSWSPPPVVVVVVVVVLIGPVRCACIVGVEHPYLVRPAPR